MVIYKKKCNICSIDQIYYSLNDIFGWDKEPAPEDFTESVKKVRIQPDPGGVRVPTQPGKP